MHESTNNPELTLWNSLRSLEKPVVTAHRCSCISAKWKWRKTSINWSKIEENYRKIVTNRCTKSDRSSFWLKNYFRCFFRLVNRRMSDNKTRMSAPKGVLEHQLYYHGFRSRADAEWAENDSVRAYVPLERTLRNIVVRYESAKKQCSLYFLVE